MRGWITLAGLLLVGWTVAWAADVRDPTGFDDSDQLQWARDVSRRMHVLTISNRTPHGRRFGFPGQLLYVRTDTNRWVFINDGRGPGASADWVEIDVNQ